MKKYLIITYALIIVACIALVAIIFHNPIDASSNRIIGYNTVNQKHTRDYVPSRYSTTIESQAKAILNITKGDLITQDYSRGFQAKDNIIHVELILKETGESICKNSFYPRFPSTIKPGSTKFGVDKKEVAEWVQEQWEAYLTK